MKRLIIPLSILLVCVFIITGCGGGTTTPPAEPAATTAAPVTTAATTAKPAITTPAALTPQYGGDLTIIDVNSPFENLGYPSAPSPRYNPFLPYPCVETLLRPDEQGLPTPWLATDFKWSTDNKSLTLNLRKGVKFHDGTDFNAAAVKYNLDLFLPPSTRPELVNVESIDVVDDYTVRLNCKVYDGLIPVNLCATPGSMVSPTAIQKYGKDWCITNPVGTGPFKFNSYTRDISIKYVKNTDYWQEGKPYLNSITIMRITDPVTAKASFLAGEGQVITSLSPMDADQLNKTGKYNIVSCQVSVTGIGFDSANADSPFGNVKVRQAVSYAIDNKSIVDAIGYGIFTPANQIANSKDWAHNPNVLGYPYNPQKAKELLNEAGFPNGFNTKLTYQTGDAVNESLLLAIQRYLGEVGIKVEMDPVAPARYSQVITGGWQSSMVAYMGIIEIGYPVLNTFKLNLQKNAVNYKSFLRPDNIQAAFEAGTAETDQGKLVAIVHNLQTLLIDEHCIVKVVMANRRIGATYPTVHIKLFDPWWVHWQPENVWLSK